MENLFNLKDHLSLLIKDLTLIDYHFLFRILSYYIVNKAIIHLSCYIDSFYTVLYLKNKFTVLSQFLVKDPKCFFTFPIMKNIVVIPSRFRFPVKLSFYNAFESALSAFCLPKSIAIVL